WHARPLVGQQKTIPPLTKLVYDCTYSYPKLSEFLCNGSTFTFSFGLVLLPQLIAPDFYAVIQTGKDQFFTDLCEILEIRRHNNSPLFVHLTVHGASKHQSSKSSRVCRSQWKSCQFLSKLGPFLQGVQKEGIIQPSCNDNRPPQVSTEFC